MTIPRERQKETGQVFRRAERAFTLAELLIALSILGVIATFTIPKVLQAQQDSSFKARAKEAAGMISEGLMKHRQDGLLNPNTKPIDLFPYFNYVAQRTSGVIDNNQGSGTSACAPATPCLELHSGGVLRASGSQYFNGTSTSHAIGFTFDPDGKETTVGSTTGPGKSIDFILYYNGRLTTYGTCLNPSRSSVGNFSPNPAADPPWFSWD